MLDGLQHHLITPELTEVFCKEYTEHMNWLRHAHVASEAGLHTGLAKIERETDRQAICDGVPGVQVKDRKTELEARRIEGKKTLAIDLHGHLAGILSLANKAKGGIR